MDYKYRRYHKKQADRHARPKGTYRQKGQEESLPSFLFFRIRLIICFVLFIAFAFYNRQVPETGQRKEQTAEVFQMISEDADSDRWKKITEPSFLEKKMKEVSGLFGKP